MQETQAKQKRFAMSGWALFVIVQIVAVPSVVAAIWWRGEQLYERPLLPKLRNEAAIVTPQYDYPSVVSDDQLQSVLHKLRPRLRGPEPKINHVDHALRFWGTKATFDDPKCLSGQEMFEILTDHEKFTEMWGESARPLLMSSENGIAVRTQQGRASASHVDHTLASLAECGLSLDTTVVTAEGEVPLEQLMLHSLRDFHLNQFEYEWTALALATYAESNEPWYSKEGQEITFDRLARRIMRQQWTQGVCFGNHRLYTLTIMLRIDEETPLFIEPGTRAEVMDHLQRATARLVSTQSAEGWWDKNWHNTDVSAEDPKFEALSRRLLATGHAMEWWAVAPRELHPPRETLVRAGQWLVREVEQLDEEKIVKNYTFLTHVGRALLLWRRQIK